MRKATLDPDSLEDDGDLVSTTAVPVLLAELLVEGADALDSYYPRVSSATATIDAGVLSVEAEIEGPVEQAVLWQSWSEDRRWSEEGQADWLRVELTDVGGTWTGEVDLAVEGVADMAIGWYVEARNTLALGESEHVQSDASPVRFLQLLAPETCEPFTAVYCEGF